MSRKRTVTSLLSDLQDVATTIDRHSSKLIIGSCCIRQLIKEKKRLKLFLDLMKFTFLRKSFNVSYHLSYEADIFVIPYVRWTRWRSLENAISTHSLSFYHACVNHQKKTKTTFRQRWRFVFTVYFYHHLIFFLILSFLIVMRNHFYWGRNSKKNEELLTLRTCLSKQGWSKGKKEKNR